LVILGIDPGSRIVGYGVIEKQNGDLLYKTCGIIQTNPQKSQADNLVQINEQLENLIDIYKPDVAGVEKIFFAKNVKTVIGVSEGRGVILFTIKRYGIPIIEFTPLQVKQAVTGDGVADKKQVQKMVKMILRLTKEPSPDDAADALAIAICAANQQTLASSP